MTKREIEEQARKLLADHGLMSLAVDPIVLANKLDIRVYNAKFGDENTHGLLAKREGRATIYVNADDLPARKRFTIAHELGHFVLHLVGADGEFVDNADNFRTTFDPESDWSAERRREWEANVFASALLMDEAAVRKQWDEFRELDTMAHQFQVSRQAMAIRLESLGIAVG